MMYDVQSMAILRGHGAAMGNKYIQRQHAIPMKEIKRSRETLDEVAFVSCQMLAHAVGLYHRRLTQVPPQVLLKSSQSMESPGLFRPE